ncbi:hypothetical protein [Pelagicoccus sp. SDUM812002]|uniref:hypothetical protein n=1 Tax=Pelagicoccus sp. SDUM812002 TaxID=3041266 RepID=UPI00280E956B|nr:hypothetical protein [Pelagicoccus sp. SDUM812002]MDQ8184309.1 hypothetical protein [Pelagicoccus sp. SDUM812002]
MRHLFQQHLESVNLPGSGKASSYLKALEHLSRMIEYEPLGFADCQDIFSVHSLKRLNELYEVTNEQKHLGRKSIWVVRGIPRSYLQNGYCTAAIRSYQEFLIQHAYESDLLERYDSFQGEAEEPRPASSAKSRSQTPARKLVGGGRHRDPPHHQGPLQPKCIPSLHSR